MDKKKEPGYLDLSASCNVSVTEMLQRFFSPAQERNLSPEGEQEVQDDDNG